MIENVNFNIFLGIITFVIFIGIIIFVMFVIISLNANKVVVTEETIVRKCSYCQKEFETQIYKYKDFNIIRRRYCSPKCEKSMEKLIRGLK